MAILPDHDDVTRLIERNDMHESGIIDEIIRLDAHAARRLARLCAHVNPAIAQERAGGKTFQNCS
jgi:hypothetical protein